MDPAQTVIEDVPQVIDWVIIEQPQCHQLGGSQKYECEHLPEQSLYNVQRGVSKTGPAPPSHRFSEAWGRQGVPLVWGGNGWGGLTPLRSGSRPLLGEGGAEPPPSPQQGINIINKALVNSIGHDIVISWTKKIRSKHFYWSRV